MAALFCKCYRYKKKKKACWLFLDTFSSEIFVAVRLYYCKQQHNCAAPCQPKELGQALVTVSPLSDISSEIAFTVAYLKVKLFPLSGAEPNWLLMNVIYFLHLTVLVSFNFKINFLTVLPDVPFVFFSLSMSQTFLTENNKELSNPDHSHAV